MRKTKIVCTLGPATDNEDVLRKLMLAGMNVARLNFSHGTHEEQKKRMDMVKKLRAELGLPIAILLDTKGPEIRTRDFEGGKVEVKAGDFFTLTTRDIVGDSTITSITYKDLYKDVQVGTHILIDDGLIELEVTSISGEDILCTVITGGPISNHKGINVPDVHLNMPYLSEVDESDILFGIEQDVDFVAASFIRSAKDVLEIRELLNANGGQRINIISKIENSEGVNHIDDIIYVSDGIMVARGDMGVEIPCEEVPVIKKMIINKVYMAGKQVITATQMLDSMIKNPRPTRAETTDVANAIYDGTSAVMLSGESAAGKYPVEAVEMMAKIAERAEAAIDYKKNFYHYERAANQNVTDAVCHAACTTAIDLNAAAVIIVTKSGVSARNISKYRPSCNIIAGTTSDKAYRQLNMSWGVTPVHLEEQNEVFTLFDHAVAAGKKQGLLQAGDKVVIGAGVPLGISGNTNMLKVQVVE
ncbi:pyruvate kinase [Eubacterium sp. MSJ-33]|uniref:pyruvate kinase n=1 Tax=Eubacterium sp. MSJ-33 TaxID=2841528 RepID=UPI001C767FCD|nr:pyruvate kinase [Eubacterium sp. MSJ-33]QWT52070.1 pyruvate kinase [Eubacterium sp. MSJ-33]